MQKVVVITGASSGIGRATAEEFARHKYAVVVIARRKDRLEKLIGELEKRHPHQRFLAIRCDVSKWEAVENAVREISAEFSGVNVLVNNAGSFDYQSFENCSSEKVDSMIDVNIRGVIYMTKASLPLLKSAAKLAPPSKIVNVSSIGGLWGFSNMVVYTATKFAVTGFSSALRRVLRTENIDVASIHPGPVDSADEPKPRKKSGLVMLPPQIAGQIYQLASSKRRRYISHPAFRLLNAIENFSPEIVDRILRKIL